MEKKKHGLTEQDGNIILNESGTFLSTDKLDDTNESDKKGAEEKELKNFNSSAGPEEKDITD